MILCNSCNAVRPNDVTRCLKCFHEMSISQRAAAAMHIPERQFFENVLHEIESARRKYPDKPRGHLVAEFSKDLMTLGYADFSIRLIIVAALAARLYTEGCRETPRPFNNGSDPLDELETRLKGL